MCFSKSVGVPWPNGLVHRICVPMAESSECGFDSRGAYVLEQDTLPYNSFSPPRSKWVPVRAELVVVFD